MFDTLVQLSSGGESWKKKQRRPASRSKSHGLLRGPNCKFDICDKQATEKVKFNGFQLNGHCTCAVTGFFQ